MAYAALVSLAQTIDQFLNDHRYSISPHEQQQIICIHEFVIFLQSFLEDFGEKASSLEARIVDVANEAEDVIEYSMLEQIQRSKRMFGFSKSKVKRNLRDRFRKENVLMQEFESIAGEAMDMKNNSIRVKDMPVIGYFTAEATSSRLAAPTGKIEMVGFSDDLIAIKERLCGESSKLQIIPIFGMGGIGKTTLARNAYDDPLTMEHFDIRIWVTVSQDYSVCGILSSILASLKLSNEIRSEQGNDSIMAQKVYQYLKGRRYVIVMDDMWSTKVWDDLRIVFPDDHNGSRIMLTTRLLDVAANPDASCPLHEMQFMGEEQSWDLLRQKVFKQENCPPELEDIAKDIARNCRGLPLAIVVIAGLLSTISKTRASWGQIAVDIKSVVAAKDGEFEKILSLSYINLPHHLRSYFLYMGAFPEDYEIRVSKLIKLWVAEGLSKRNGSISYEEEAEDCLIDLIKRSLVVVTKRKSNGKIKSCGIHDLVRDFCIKKAKEEKFLLHLDEGVHKTLPKTVRFDHRRVSITCSGSPLHIVSGSTTHSIMCFHRLDEIDYSNCRLLRVLDTAPSYINSISPNLYQLFHLRYLALFRIPILPAISKLQNLQTLIFRHPRGNLPMEIWRLTQLRHLEFDGYLPNPEGAASALENLQTLSCPKNLQCSKRILNMIPNVKKLELDYTTRLERYNDTYQDFYLNNLVCLHQLENLTLRKSLSRELSVAFPKTLKKLTLQMRQCHWEGTTPVGSLPNLEVLKLIHCAYEGGRWETTEGQFLQLRFLLIEQSNLQDWTTESSHFPRLKYLLLHHCQGLSEIPDGFAEIPTLELIDVKGLNRYLVDSAKRIQEEQQSFGNDLLQVRCMWVPPPYNLINY